MDKCPLLGAKFGRRKTLRSACRPIGPGNRAEQYRQILEHQVNVGYFLSIHFKLSFKNCKLQIVSFQVESYNGLLSFPVCEIESWDKFGILQWESAQKRWVNMATGGSSIMEPSSSEKFSDNFE